jgi:glycosyltransferase involved in cell wall biosynthesis
MILFFYIIIGIYTLTISVLIYGFTKIKTYKLNNLKPKTAFSIVVPFRNEADNLPTLLESFSKLDYPTALFEVILVDDASEKEFRIQDSRFKIQVIKNIRTSASPKKDALVTAINCLKNDWIITTDADCLINPKWLLTLDHFIQEHDPEMVVGPVNYSCKNHFLHYFQQLDMASLQGATLGSFGIKKGFMCNGANFAYTKSIFESLHGFEGNNTIASGDDVFLLQKAMTQFPEQVHYLKSENHIVMTKPLDNWKNLFYQRVRWASKTSSYSSFFGKFLGLVVFAGNLFWILSLVFGIIGLLSIQDVVFLILIKFIVDFILIYKTNAFFKTKTRFAILSSMLYPFFSVSVALYSLFGKYEWKGRSFKH